MRQAVSVTLAFFALVSAMGAYRDINRAIRDPRPARYLGVTAAALMAFWCLYAAWWTIRP